MLLWDWLSGARCYRVAFAWRKGNKEFFIYLSRAHETYSEKFKILSEVGHAKQRRLMAAFVKIAHRGASGNFPENTRSGF